MNFVSDLYNIFAEICKNDVFVESCRAEDQFIYIQDIVKILKSAEKDEENFSKLNSILSKVKSWQKLKTEIKMINRLRKDERNKLRKMRNQYEESSKLEKEFNKLKTRAKKNEFILARRTSLDSKKAKGISAL